MSERSCAGALAPYNRAPVFDLNAWRAAVTGAWTRGTQFRLRVRPRRPRADKAALALASLNDHALADIGIHRSQIPAFAHRVAEHSAEHPISNPPGNES
jgi:uncharacterized protein YjiS (DUF1127 family)